MSMLRAVVRNGCIEPEEPMTLPEGTKLYVFTLLPEEKEQDFSDYDFEEGWDNSPEGIAAWLDWYETLRPNGVTKAEIEAQEQDERKSEEWTRQCAQYEAAKMLEEMKDLFP